MSKRNGVEWDIDANLPVYTRDYLRLDHPAVHWERIDDIRIVLSSGEKFSYRKNQVEIILKPEDNAEFRWEILEEKQKQPTYTFAPRRWSRAELKELIAAALAEDTMRRNLEEFKREGRGD